MIEMQYPTYSKDIFVQCKLKSLSGYYLHSWVPVKLAKTGKRVRIQIDKKWEDGWEIIETYDTFKVEGEELRVLESEYRSHRKRTDI
jgi:hypothetical protein